MEPTEFKKGMWLIGERGNRYWVKKVARNKRFVTVIWYPPVGSWPMTYRVPMYRAKTMFRKENNEK